MPVAEVSHFRDAPDDVSRSCHRSCPIDPAGVIAVLGKTEGNGLVNDCRRGFADLALSLLFQRFLRLKTRHLEGVIDSVSIRRSDRQVL